ncbi:hypothetical protein HK101_011030 [Irineochytrium annulatum]|nr:hypothetical protein HK101_011030 [Irineochytrium annulatum]
MVTVTIRLIKSFEYRTFKNVVLHDLDAETTTVSALKALLRQKIQTESGFKPYRNVDFDTLKLYFVTHGAKTQNLIINLDHDDWFLEDAKTLSEVGIIDESEISFFNREAYEAFKANPEVKW